MKTFSFPALPGMEQNYAAYVTFAQGLPLNEKIRQSIELLRLHEAHAIDLNNEGYWLAFSGGKDSVVVKDLAIQAGVKFRAVYNVTTIDPPELVRFIKREHPYVVWNRARRGLLARMVEKSSGPPTRRARWCCAEFKERGGDGFVKVLGVRAAESPRRAALWKPVLHDRRKGGWLVNPILYWTDSDVWQYIRDRELPYCSLYDEGFTRLGCVGCPLSSKKQQLFELNRWPAIKRAWRAAFEKYWNRWHGVPTLQGKVRWFEDFGSAEELWKWWLTQKAKLTEAEKCQMNLDLFEHGDDDD